MIEVVPVKVKDIMSREVVSVDKDARLDSVLETMRKHGMSKLVVTDRGVLAGIVTDGDIADEMGAVKNRGVPASHLHASSAMIRSFTTTTPEEDVHVVLADLLQQGIGIMPVMHEKACVGVVTASDLLRLVDGAKSLEALMTPHVHAVQPSDRVIHARRLMVDHHIERLPVMDDGKLVGIVGESDIANGLAKFKDTVSDHHQPAALQRFLVEDIYQRNVITAPAHSTAHEAAQRMMEHDVGCLPVMRGDRLVGIVTRSDLLKLVPVPQPQQGTASARSG
ncbi:MAG: CBS domain-containing protein [Candidatus Thermoplasmatota archaeon]